MKFIITFFLLLCPWCYQSKPPIEAPIKTPIQVVHNLSPLFTIVNQKRKEAGLKEFKYNPKLELSAKLKATHMIENDYWSHDAPNGTKPWYFFKQAGYHYSTAGENLAKDFSSDEDVVQAWMDSPAHRENILGNYKEMGIYSIECGLQGKSTTLIVQHFGSERN
jgi:uncharacterized protein YkwD